MGADAGSDGGAGFLTKITGTYSRIVIVDHALGVWVLLRHALHYARRKGMNTRSYYCRQWTSSAAHGIGSGGVEVAGTECASFL